MALPNSCSLCGAGAVQQNVVTNHVYGGREDQAYFRCQGCEVIYLYPQLSTEEQGKFYASGFEDFMAKRSGRADDYSGPEQHTLAHEQQRLRRLPFLEPYLPGKNGRILEIGCSSGFMLKPLEKIGCSLFGVEPSELFLDHLASCDIKAWPRTEALLDTEDAKLGFDLIMHFFVMEHVEDTKSFIQQQIDLLKPGGNLIIEIPNADEPLVTLYNVPEFEQFYWTVMHNWYFSKKAFENFLNQFNLPFEINLDQRYGLSNHMIWARDGKPGGQGQFSADLDEEFDRDYKDALIRSGKCDTLFGIIHRPK